MIKAITSFFINFGWKNVRALGELKVLTKASYLTLVIVPVLATIWPAIRLFFNGYNSVIKNSIVGLELATVELQNASVSIDSLSQESNLILKADSILNDVQSKLPILIEDTSKLSITSTNLPDVWVYAFLASLAVFIAHIIYEWHAPEIVRKLPHREYVAEQKGHYSNNPTFSMLFSAVEELGKDEADYPKDIFTIEGPEERYGLRMDRLNYIERGADTRYNRLSRVKPFWSWTSGVLYVGSLSFLLWITGTQALKVLEAAGWL